MEAKVSPEVPSLIDLSEVEEGRRAAAWTAAVPSLFPGLSVNLIEGRPAAGDIRRIPMGGGTLWSVRSPRATVGYSPSAVTRPEFLSFTVMLQVQGRSYVAQQQRSCALDAGGVCLVDEQFPFTIDGRGDSEIVFVRMPRNIVLSRNPHLEHQTVISSPGLQPGVTLLARTISTAMLTAPFMGESQRRATLAALIEMLGAAEIGEAEPAGSAWWRVKAALSYIELHFSVHGLTAEDVARSQRISRRRLDQLLRETIGLSITGQIWRRRLEQAAGDLSNPARASSTVSQIAFSNGFEDAAHFTRAFKRHCGYSPLQWRKRGRGAVVEHPAVQTVA